MAKTGETLTGSMSFLPCLSFLIFCIGILVIVVTLSFIFDFGRFSFLFCLDLFTVHIRPVLIPCQAGDTCSIIMIMNTIII